MNYSELKTDLIAIARKAGEAIMDIYENEADFGIEKKGDDSPLTKADQAANAIICEALEKLTPQVPIISEENRQVAYEERKSYDYCWLVDPLDGTKEFIKRNGEFTVNIALLHGNRSVMGVVFAPVLDEMYWAIQGAGAYLSVGGAEAKRLKPKPFKRTDEGLNLVCSRSHLNDGTKRFIEDFSKPNLVSKGSSLKFLIIAKGEAHVYPRIAPTMEWDTGAAQIILEEAGGKVLQFESQSPLVYNKENLLNPFFVAFGPMV